MAYLTEAAEEQKLMEKIRFNVNVESASWDSGDNQWHLVTGSGERYRCNMLLGCTGYFSYENPYQPNFLGVRRSCISCLSAYCGCNTRNNNATSLISGQENFLGTIVHPQNWTSEHDQILEGKRVALIGSGATAITIFPGIKVQICSY